MHTCNRLVAVLLIVFTMAACLAACGPELEEPTHEDFVASLTLDMDSPTNKQEVTVKSYIDGDTTHFNFPGFNSENVLKARYISINTPESTGTIEEWGKKASNYTKNALKSATSIIIESDTDDGKWNADSTGDRYLVWVWYKPEGSEQYRNLNLEILQNGLAVASNSQENRYGDICMKAIAQARNEKLHVYSGEKDPDFFYGQAAEITLKELRTNLETYKDKKVAFEGIVSKIHSNAVYVEDFDEETGMSYGMYIYYGFSLRGKGLQMLTTIGNRVRIVGSVQYWETGKSYQVSDLSYDVMEPNSPSNLRLISQNNVLPYTETSIETFNSKVKLTVGTEDAAEEKEFAYAELALGTTRTFKNLTVIDIYTTQNGGDNDGAMTLTCRDENGKEVTIRTTVLRDADKNLITEREFLDKVITVKGVIDAYDGDYQLKIFSMSDVTFH